MRYFQGQEVTGKVFSGNLHTFRDVVEKLNVCPQLPLSRKAFLAMPKKERQSKKRVPYLVPSTFAESPSARQMELAIECNLIFVDIDEDEKTGKCPAKPFVENPDLLYSQLRGFNFAAHTTASSTPEKPRMRLIVDAEKIPVSLYRKAVDTIGDLIGISKVTSESRNPIQPMFLPTQFSDDTEEQHPLIATHLDGRAFTVEDIRGDSPDYYSAGGGKAAVSKSAPLDDLEFLRAPTPEVTLEIASEALATLDPDCPYEEWFAIAAALRHQFPHETDEAYAIFDEWSAGGTKYGGTEETAKKWKSINQTPAGRAPITIHTLLKMAVQAGWDGTPVKDKGYVNVVEWMAQAKTVTELLEQGVRKILTMPLLSSVQEGMLLDQLRLHAKERFAYKVSVSDIKKDLSRLRANMVSSQKPEERKVEPKWVRGVCFVTTPGEFYRPLSGEKYTPQTFDMKYGRFLLPTPKSLIAAGMPVNETTLSKPLVRPSDYALNFLKIPTFYDYAYNPAQPNEMLFVVDKRKYVNTYVPTYPENDPERAGEAGRVIMRHLTNLIAEEDYRTTFVDWLAHNVQFPGAKIRWALVLQGTEGAGKTFFAEMMKAVLGRRHVKMVDGSTIMGGWNEWTFGYQMVVIEEVRIQGANKFDIMNRLKPWITNDDIPINEKYANSRDVTNITNYMLFSNHHDCLVLTPGDRRYFVVKSALQEKSQVLALGKDYFLNLFNFLNTYPGAVRAWLANWKISPSFSAHAQAPRTKYVEDLIADSASSVTEAVRRILREGDHPLLQYDILSSKVLTEVLMNDEGLHRLTAQNLASVLREEGYRQLGRCAINEERHYLWARAGITEAQAQAEVQHRVKHNLRHLEMHIFI